MYEASFYALCAYASSIELSHLVEKRCDKVNTVGRNALLQAIEALVIIYLLFFYSRLLIEISIVIEVLLNHETTET